MLIEALRPDAAAGESGDDIAGAGSESGGIDEDAPGGDNPETAEAGSDADATAADDEDAAGDE